MKGILPHKFIHILSKTNILHKSQSGFRKNNSYNTAILKLIDTWLKNIDQGMVMETVFLDLKKAFELVEIRLHKLELYHLAETSIY